jgi:murein tripeptide amidase MpaA
MGRKRDIRKELVEQTGDESLLFADGFDSCIIGYALYNGVYKVIYDKSKILIELSKHMSFEESDEYFLYNIQNAYVGDRTPVYVDRYVKVPLDR